MRTIFKWTPPTILLILAFTLWEILVHSFAVPDWLLPPPSQIFVELFNTKELLYTHAQITLREIVIGLLVSLGLAFSLSIAISWSDIVERTLLPFVITSQIIPIFTLAPLILIWVGTGISSKIVVVVLFTFFPVVISTVNGLKSGDKKMSDMLKTLGANRVQLYLKFYVPNALPQIFSGIKVAAVLSVIGAVIGEWIGSSGGLGWLIKLSGPQFKTERIFAAIFVLSILALTLYTITVIMEKILLRKYPDN
ncbi:MAG: ABC transporter permease [Dehalococcoidia bacterium]|jgi:putative hydroxymethylpyrimidine transport system permease protein|nr:ABC transporter permease [Dehalococcoidia bacterium]MDP7613017.1 ABC transporter permease [Dehalococcoidia bacterium]